MSPPNDSTQQLHLLTKEKFGLQQTFTKYMWKNNRSPSFHCHAMLQGHGNTDMDTIYQHFANSKRL